MAAAVAKATVSVGTGTTPATIPHATNYATAEILIGISGMRRRRAEEICRLPLKLKFTTFRP